MADWLYLAGTGLQIAAFHMHMQPTTLGLGLTVYGIALYWFASGWK